MKKNRRNDGRTSLSGKQAGERPLGRTGGRGATPAALISVSALTAAAILIPGLIVARNQEARPPAATVGNIMPADSGIKAASPASGGSPAVQAPVGDTTGTGSKPAAVAGEAGSGEAAGAGSSGNTAAKAVGSGQAAADKPGSKDSPGAQQGKSAVPKLTALDLTQVRVYLSKEKRIERVPMETYIRGVLAGEMPITFEPEALKAQAIAARTYIVKRLASGDKSGLPVEGADVTDTTAHQVYVPLKQLLGRWSGKEREANLTKLNAAVQGTRGEIVTYNGSPIQALFFSTSNGYTENSEDYWDASLPYLRSVASPWDKKISPEYKETTSMKLASFYQKLGISGSTPSRSLRVLDTTDGKRIRELAAGKTTFSGRQAREKLGLASSQFTWKISGDEIEITTYGYGHGVGMSQWGADGMAKEGKDAYQILTHYYSGTKVVRQNELPRLS